VRRRYAEEVVAFFFEDEHEDEVALEFDGSGVVPWRATKSAWTLEESLAVLLCLAADPD